MELAAPAVRAPGGVERAWCRVGRTSGYVVAAATFVATVLYLLDATGAIGSDPDYHATGAGPLQDEASFWVALFAHRHHVLWDVIARDTLYPVAFVALAVLALAVRALVGADDPRAQLLMLFFAVGGVVSALSDLIYLGNVEWWRITGWSASQPEQMVAIGRSTETISKLTVWLEAAGFVVLAAGLLALGRLCRSRVELPSRLALLAEVEALLLLGVAVAGVEHADTAYDVFALLTGALVGPAVGLWLAATFGRRRTTSPVSAH
jgi:hypothetical protein